jgi:SpoVK/Ycf46/Vps4 family AAA+-type ATPase
MRSLSKLFSRRSRHAEIETLIASPARHLNQLDSYGFGWDDIAGLEDAKQSVQEVTDFIRNPRRFQALGARIPQSILFTGPAGCGKSLLAVTIMAEYGCPAFPASGADFVLMTPGVRAPRMRNAFQVAQGNKPCFLLIEDIDAFARTHADGSNLPPTLHASLGFAVRTLDILHTRRSPALPTLYDRRGGQMSTSTPREKWSSGSWLGRWMPCAVATLLKWMRAVACWSGHGRRWISTARV